MGLSRARDRGAHCADQVKQRAPADADRVYRHVADTEGHPDNAAAAVFDDDGNFAPVFDDTDRRTFDADTIILAIGQAIDLDALGDAETSLRSDLGRLFALAENYPELKASESLAERCW